MIEVDNPVLNSAVAALSSEAQPYIVVYMWKRTA